MTEYALILAAIAVVVYDVYAAMGNNIGSLANGVDSTLTKRVKSGNARSASLYDTSCRIDRTVTVYTDGEVHRGRYRNPLACRPDCYNEIALGNAAPAPPSATRPA
jgi:Flp pilus assembly pilin Flp